MNWRRNSERKPYLIITHLFWLLQAKKFKSFTHTIYDCNCPQNPKENQQPKPQKGNKKREEILYINNIIPWKEEVLRSLSIHFLSIRLSSTARIWKSDSLAMPIAVVLRLMIKMASPGNEEKKEQDRGWSWWSWVYILNPSGDNYSMILAISSRILRIHIDLWLTVWAPIRVLIKGLLRSA